MHLISSAQFPDLRTQLEITLVHRCTLTPVSAGAPDEHYNEADAPGTPIPGVPCVFTVAETTSRGEGGTVVIKVPRLTVSATLAISIGDQVSNITDQLGGTPPGASGAFRVDDVFDDTAGLGAALLPTYQLRQVDVVRAG